MTWSPLFFSTEGRITRRVWWSGFWTLVGIFVFENLLLESFLFGPAPGGDILLPLTLMRIVWIALLAYPSYCLHAKRFQDRAKHRTYALASVVLILVGFILMSPRLKPFDIAGLILTGAVGLWLWVELGCLRGTAGPNRFGDEPMES